VHTIYRDNHTHLEKPAGLQWIEMLYKLAHTSSLAARDWDPMLPELGISFISESLKSQQVGRKALTSSFLLES